MIHNLFDEYRFFSKYPEKELRITGILFGVTTSYGDQSESTRNCEIVASLKSTSEPWILPSTVQIKPNKVEPSLASSPIQ